MNVARLWADRLLPKGGFIRNVTLLIGGTGLGQAISVLSSPLLTRLYTPEDFGSLAVFTAMFGIIAVAAMCRYDVAIPLPEDNSAAANLFALSFGVLIVISGLVAILQWLLSDHIIVWTNSPALRPYLWLLPLAVMTSGSLSILNYWTIRNEGYTQLACAKVSQSVSAVAIQLGCGVLKFGPLGLLLGRVIGQGVQTGTLTIMTWRAGAMTALKNVSWTAVRLVAIRYVQFPIYSAPGALLTTAWVQTPALMLASLYNPQVAGWYALGQVALGAPLGMLVSSVGDVYFGEAARVVRNAPQKLYQLFMRTTCRLFLIGIVPLGIVALSGAELFRLIFGASWEQAGVYMQLMAAMHLLRLTVIPVATTLGVIRRQDLFLVLSSFRFILVVFVFLLSAWLGLSSTLAVTLYSATMSAIYIGHFLIIIFALRKFVNTAGQELGSPNYE